MRGVFNKESREKPWRKKARAQKRATLKNKNPWSHFMALTKELPGAMPFAPFYATEEFACALSRLNTWAAPLGP